MIYVLLNSARRQIARVRGRVADGGNDVPEDKIRGRRTRSFEQLAWFDEHVDRLDLFDNSASVPVMMATKAAGGSLVWHRRPPGPLRAELAAAGLTSLPPLR